jgi:hypothetical protein
MHYSWVGDAGMGGDGPFTTGTVRVLVQSTKKTEKRKTLISVRVLMTFPESYLRRIAVPQFYYLYSGVIINYTYSL